MIYAYVSSSVDLMSSIMASWFTVLRANSAPYLVFNRKRLPDMLFDVFLGYLEHNDFSNDSNVSSYGSISPFSDQKAENHYSEIQQEYSPDYREIISILLRCADIRSETPATLIHYVH